MRRHGKEGHLIQEMDKCLNRVLPCGTLSILTLYLPIIRIILRKYALSRILSTHRISINNYMAHRNFSNMAA